MGEVLFLSVKFATRFELASVRENRTRPEILIDMMIMLVARIAFDFIIFFHDDMTDKNVDLIEWKYHFNFFCYARIIDPTNW